jgi:hypothetical protein
MAFTVVGSPKSHYLAYGNTINTANHTLVNWQLNMLPVEIPPRLITL